MACIFILLPQNMQGQEDSLRVWLDARPKACVELSKGMLVHNTQPKLHAELNNKVGVLSFGEVSSSVAMANLRMLQTLQEAMPRLSVVGVLERRAGFPEEESELEAYLQRFAIALPIVLDTEAELRTCNALDAQSITFILSPQGHILESMQGLLDAEYLKERCAHWTKALSPLFRMNPRPYSPAASMPALHPILHMPMALAVNASEEILFVSDFGANRILLMGVNGDLIDVIGNGQQGHTDGSLNEARFDGPWGLAWDEVSRVLYVADHFNHVIRKIDLNLNTVHTLIGSGHGRDENDSKGVGTNFNLSLPKYLALQGHTLMVSTPGSIWRIDTRTEVAERVAGSATAGYLDGKGDEALLMEPAGMAFDPSGSLIFAERQSSTIRELNEDGKVSTLSGKGPGAHGYSDNRRQGIQWHGPLGVHSHEGQLYIADAYNHSIRSLAPYKNRSETLAGNGLPGEDYGRGEDAAFRMPTDHVAHNGTLYLCDAGNGLLKKMELKSRKVEPMPLYNYGQISVNYNPVINDLRDLDTLFLKEGSNYFNFDIQLTEGFEFDQGGLNTFALSSRNDSLFIASEAMEEGHIRFHYKLEPGLEIAPIVIDFRLYIREKERKERQYYRGVSFIVPTARALEGQKPEDILIDLDPVQLTGGAIQPEGQLFMD